MKATIVVIYEKSIPLVSLQLPVILVELRGFEKGGNYVTM